MPIRSLSCALLLVPCLMGATAWAQPRYTVTGFTGAPVDAFTAGPVALNDAGQVLFTGRETGTGRSTAWLATPGGATVNLLSAVDHVPAPGHTLSLEAFDLNDRGQVAGMWQTHVRRGTPVPWQAFLYDPAAGMAVLNNAVGGPGFAWRVNDRGQVAGFRDADGRRETYLHDPRSGATRFTGVGIGFGDGGLDNAGRIAGTTFDLGAQTTRVALFDPATGAEADLGAGGLGARPRDMNDAGWIAGERVDAAGRRQPVLYRPDLGFRALGRLDGLPAEAEGAAHQVNGSGRVLGSFWWLDGDAYASRSFLHDPRWGLLDLADLLVPTADGWSDVAATAINDLGQMVGTARGQDGLWHTVWLTPSVSAPVPEPGMAALALIGLAGIAWRRRAAA